MSDCSASLHPRAQDGFHLFNEGNYFEAHEALEDAWNASEGTPKSLYRGILQIAVTYLHITRGNYNGAIKVYDRSRKWFQGIPAVCMGIHVLELQQDTERVMREVYRLGTQHISDFDASLFGTVKWGAQPHVYFCDRCGSEMRERNCKVTCPNCGNRFDCSDLNIYFD